jgi:hypothetical protein
VALKADRHQQQCRREYHKVLSASSSTPYAHFISTHFDNDPSWVVPTHSGAALPSNVLCRTAAAADSCSLPSCHSFVLPRSSPQPSCMQVGTSCSRCRTQAPAGAVRIQQQQQGQEPSYAPSTQ